MSDEPDVNDAFESIAFSEERIANAAFEEGFKKGTADGLAEGYHLGYHRSAELGFEIGMYRGLLSSLNHSEVSPRITAVAEKLASAINLIPETNQSDCDILGNLDSARASFKQLVSLLKLPAVNRQTSSF